MRLNKKWGGFTVKLGLYLAMLAYALLKADEIDVDTVLAYSAVCAVIWVVVVIAFIAVRDVVTINRRRKSIFSALHRHPKVDVAWEEDRSNDPSEPGSPVYIARIY